MSIEAERKLWDLVDNAYELSYAEWIELLRSVASELEKALCKTTSQQSP